MLILSGTTENGVLAMLKMLYVFMLSNILSGVASAYKNDCSIFPTIVVMLIVITMPVKTKNALKFELNMPDIRKYETNTNGSNRKSFKNSSIISSIYFTLTFYYLSK
jgi:hypothetical protein